MIHVVSIGEMAVSDAPDDVLVAYGLGSCVAVCLYDPWAKVGGMLHALLPTANERARGNPNKFVDQGVPRLMDSLLKLGANRVRLEAKVCGGAQMLTAPTFDRLNIGKLNVLAAERALQAASLQIQARATDGHIGRTMRLYVADGKVMVRTLEHGEQVL